MPIDIPLDQLSVAEKVQLLERVWDSLCQESGDVRSPEWHKAAERRRHLEDGSVTVSSWDDAKQRLMNLGK